MYNHFPSSESYIKKSIWTNGAWASSPLPWGMKWGWRHKTFCDLLWSHCRLTPLQNSGALQEAGAVFSEPYDHAASCRITPNPNALSQAEHQKSPSRHYIIFRKSTGNFPTKLIFILKEIETRQQKATKLHTVLDKVYHIHFPRTLESDSDICSSKR